MQQIEKSNGTALWQAVDVVCDTPVLLLLQAIWMGYQRFDKLQKATGLTKPVLSDRLKKLISTGLLEKRAYQTSPTRYEYVLIEKGLTLYRIAIMMLSWEKRWSQGRLGTVYQIVHTSCGAVVDAVVACSDCGEPITPFDVTLVSAPGLGTTPEKYNKRRRQLLGGPSSDQTQTIFRELAELFGDRWATLLVQAAFLGVRRFDDLRIQLNISTNILSDRLAWLIEKGILIKRQYQDSPPRSDYRLTKKGYDLYPILLLLLDWSNTHFSDSPLAGVRLQHTSCGSLLRPYLRCSACGDPLLFQDLRLTTGHQAMGGRDGKLTDGGT